ncbi:MAG: hypothetical protein JWP01_2768 [Myxococcales bacterium]|nr:hypothetical protein [Myxococcales bacterium]
MTVVRLASVAIVGLVAGCFTKPEQFGGTGSDAGRDAVVDPDAGDGGGTPCSFGPFVGQTFNADVTGEPTIRTDGSEFFFAYQLRGNAWEIRSGVRTATTSFTPGPGLPTETDEEIDQDPSISDDGSVMVYRSLKGGMDPYVAQVKRSGTNWSDPFPVLTGIPVASVDLSGDGKTLYFTVDGDSLRKATRTNLEGSFTVEGTDLGGPYRLATVSPSGRELFHSGDPSSKELWRTSRLAPSGPFGPSDLLADTVFDPDLSGDGLRLIVATPSGGVSIATRTCVP